MMKKRFDFVAVVIVITFMLMGCATLPKSDSATTATPGTTSDASTETQKVKGINDWEGEITGKPAPDSKFKNLQIGMSMRQVIDLIGMPTDQGAYLTGKAFIPFYFGSDKHRTELLYKGQGRLVFAGGSAFGGLSSHVIMIIHNAQEGGYR